jgi:type I restriction enzyme S subunit
MFGDIFLGQSKYPTIKIKEVVSLRIERASKDFASDEIIRYVDILSIDNTKNVVVGYTEYTKENAPSRAQQHVKKGDIIISTVRPNLNNVARISDNYNNIVASSGFCVLRATNVETNYLFSLVSMQSFADYLSSLTLGANYPAVSNNDILNFKIPNPPIELQNQFAEFVKLIDKSKFVGHSKYFL